MPEQDPQNLRPRAARGAPGWLWLLVALALAAAAAWWWWLRPEQLPTPPEAPPAAAEPAAEAPAPDYPPPQASEPLAALPALADSDALVQQALTTLLGAERARQWLLADGLLRRFVATVDNLARAQAPARLWPVHPSAGRFTVTPAADGQGEVIAPANAARYAGFVALLEAVPPQAALQLYAQLYPLLQTAYEELGFPGRSFNNRVIEVIDHLLAMPEPAGPLAVRLTPVAGDVPSLRPWVRYEFADPALEQRSSGQKWLLRMGVEPSRRVKTVLRALRAGLV